MPIDFELQQSLSIVFSNCQAGAYYTSLLIILCYRWLYFVDMTEFGMRQQNYGTFLASNLFCDWINWKIILLSNDV